MTFPQVAFRAVGGLCVIVASFWVTLKVLDYRGNASGSAGAAPAPRQIRVVDATYGLNCQGKIPSLKPGNATQSVTQTCGGKVGTCAYTVTTNTLGDPAPGCAKDFIAKWQCGAASDPRQVQASAEANGKNVDLTCP
jgi:hypothetical protein